MPLQAPRGAVPRWDPRRDAPRPASAESASRSCAGPAPASGAAAGALCRAPPPSPRAAHCAAAARERHGCRVPAVSRRGGGSDAPRPRELCRGGSVVPAVTVSRRERCAPPPRAVPRREHCTSGHGVAVRRERCAGAPPPRAVPRRERCAPASSRLRELPLVQCITAGAMRPRSCERPEPPRLRVSDHSDGPRTFCLVTVQVYEAAPHYAAPPPKHCRRRRAVAAARSAAAAGIHLVLHPRPHPSLSLPPTVVAGRDSVTPGGPEPAWRRMVY